MMKRFTVIAATAMLATGCGGSDEKVRYVTVPGDDSPSQTEEYAALDAPRGVSHRSLDGAELLRWGTPSDTESASAATYNVYMYDPVPDREDAFVRYNSSPVSGNRMTLSDLQTGQTYWFQVAALDDDGTEGSRSTTVRVTAGGGRGDGLPTSDSPDEYDGSSDGQ